MLQFIHNWRGDNWIHTFPKSISDLSDRSQVKRPHLHELSFRGLKLSHGTFENSKSDSTETVRIYVVILELFHQVKRGDFKLISSINEENHSMFFLLLKQTYNYELITSKSLKFDNIKHNETKKKKTLTEQWRQLNFFILASYFFQNIFQHFLIKKLYY